MRDFILVLLVSITVWPMTALAVTPPEDEMGIDSLLHKAPSRALVRDMVMNAHFPKWLLAGGAKSPIIVVKQGQEKLVVMETCKPHDCSGQKVAMAYFPETGHIAAVYAATNDLGDIQTLRWYGVPANAEIEIPTILYAAITGSLTNHPTRFDEAAAVEEKR